VLGAHRYIAITGSRLATDLASRIYLALSLDGVSNVRYGDAQLRQLIGFIQSRIAYWPAPKTSDRPTP